MRKNLIGIIAMALGATAPAIANDFVVKHSDLDLSADKDQKVLERRIDSAAREYSLDRRHSDRHASQVGFCRQVLPRCPQRRARADGDPGGRGPEWRLTKRRQLGSALARSRASARPSP